MSFFAMKNQTAGVSVKVLKISFVLAALLGLAACSSIQLRDDSAVVTDRANARLEALKAGDFEKAYSFMSPGYRSVNTFQRFKGTHAGGAALLKSAVVDRVECETDTCTALIKANYYFRNSKISLANKEPMIIERVNQEDWIKVDGEWWYVRLK